MAIAFTMTLLIAGSGLTPSASVAATTTTSPVVKIEAEGIQAALKGTCTIYKDRSASGGYIISTLNDIGDAVSIVDCPEAKAIVIAYARGDEGAGVLSLYINGTHNQDVVFPNTGHWEKFYDLLSIKVDIPKGATITLQCDKGDISTNIDYVDFDPNTPSNLGAMDKYSKLTFEEIVKRADFNKELGTSKVKLVEVNREYTYEDKESYTEYKVTYTDKTTYIGKWKDGKAHGDGYFYDAKGNMLFAGEFVKGVKLNGTTYSADGQKVFSGGEYVKGMATYGSLYDDKGVLRYGGSWLDGKQDSFGFEYHANGNLAYIGGFSKGKRHTETGASGTSYDEITGLITYDGPYVNDKTTSKGITFDMGIGNGKTKSVKVKDKKKGIYTVIYENKTKYIGQWSDGKPNGKGKTYWPNNTISYDGEFKNGKRQGKGTSYSNENDGAVVYVGDWKNNKMDGNGKITFLQSYFSNYEGEWRNNLPNGTGIGWYNKNAESEVKYVGDYVDGVRHGTGKAYSVWSDYLMYIGSWENDLYHGKGAAYYSYSKLTKKYEGNWSKGEWNGYGMTYDDYGVITDQGVFKNGKKVDTSSFWNNITSISTATGQSATSLKVTNDEYYLYFSIQGTGLETEGSIYIDSDNNSKTGYIESKWTTTGLDYLISNGHLFSHSANDNTWNWTDLGTTNVVESESKTIYEARVAKSALSGLSGSIKVGFWDMNNSWELICRLPTSGVLPVYQLK